MLRNNVLLSTLVLMVYR